MERTVDETKLAGTVSDDLSMWGLFLEADVVVQIVMLMLVMASVWSWAIIIEKFFTIKKINKRADRFEDAFWSGEPLDRLYDRIKKNAADPILKTFSAGMDEWNLGVQDGVVKQSDFQAGLRQRIDRAMSVTIGREMDSLERNMTFLATVGSTAPFVGLFGTVWGIMNSFSAIASSNNTSIAVVAPGIAEALFATALGLLAAIPAVVAFNKFTSELGRYSERLDAFSNEFYAILSRHMDRQERVEDKAKIDKTAA